MAPVAAVVPAAGTSHVVNCPHHRDQVAGADRYQILSELGIVIEPAAAKICNHVPTSEK
jgi:hypothetical protein